MISLRTHSNTDIADAVLRLANAPEYPRRRNRGVLLAIDPQGVVRMALIAPGMRTAFEARHRDHLLGYYTPACPLGHLLADIASRRIELCDDVAPEVRPRGRPRIAPPTMRECHVHASR